MSQTPGSCGRRMSRFRDVEGARMTATGLPITGKGLILPGAY